MLEKLYDLEILNEIVMLIKIRLFGSYNKVPGRNGKQTPRFPEEPYYTTKFIFVNMYHIGGEVHLHQSFLKLFRH